MFKISHRKLIFLAGFIWLCVGVFLLTLGLKFLTTGINFPSPHFSLISLFSSFSGGREQASMIVLVLSLAIGYMKGRTVLTKAAKKQVQRILRLNPPQLSRLYSFPYYILLGVMFGLGFLMRVLPIAVDTRGAIDIAIGSALIHGALCYFRSLSLKPISKESQ